MCVTLSFEFLFPIIYLLFMIIIISKRVLICDDKL